jgi:hypothetical protein
VLEAIPEKSRAQADYDPEEEEVIYYREKTDADRAKEAEKARKLIAELEKQKADAEELLQRLTKAKP